MTSSSSAKFNIQQQQQQKQNEFQTFPSNSINYSLFSSRQSPSKKSPVLLTSFRYQSLDCDDLKPSFNDLTIPKIYKDDAVSLKSDNCKLIVNETSISSCVKKDQQQDKDFLSNLNKSKLNYFNKNNYDIIRVESTNETNLNSSKLNTIDQLDSDNSIFLKKYALKRHHSAPQSDIKWLQVTFIYLLTHFK